MARIIAELQANPEAQKLLLRALLTDEFLGMPARLERMETDIGTLTGDSLEGRLHRRIRPLLSQRLSLRRARMMQGPFVDTSRELFEPVEEALDGGRISDTQEARISDTDIILQARRKEDRS